MKVNKFILAGVAVLGLGMTACNNDDVPPVGDPTEGSTFVGMYISTMKDVMTKAVNDSQGDYAGREAESKLETLRFISPGKTKDWTLGSADEENKFWATATTGTYTVAPWKVTAGSQAMALLFNRGNLEPGIATATNYVYGNTATAVADITALASENKFVMASSVEQKTIQDNISKETVKTGTEEAQNVFSFDMERVVSQGMVAKGDNLNTETTDGRGSVDLDDLTYTAINGAAKTYLFRNHAGERTITESDGLYKDFTSAIDDYVDFQNAQDPNGTAREHLVRLGNLLTAQGSQTTDLGMYAAKTVAANAAEAKKVPGIYFLENSVKKEALTAGNKNYGYYRLPYAKVYATYTPKQVWDWDADQGKLISKSGVKGETFYRGEGDGLIYASKEAARKSQLNPGQNAYTYTNGRCAYRALWNRQTTADGKTVVNADVRRNNTYLLTITAFQGLGMPWDPSDPKDPYLPKPDPDPTEPTNPENPDIEKEETYMRVEVKVLQWNLVSRDVVLE